ncbi:DUF4254 domain-containing protein [Micromonospora saelicesensis]|uniref:DUF4254 domain-containing protein n=1 Tax=Micromonospora saelicesensis TaxID=285676 RepID=UPI003CFBB12F
MPLRSVGHPPLAPDPQRCPPLPGSDLIISAFDGRPEVPPKVWAVPLHVASRLASHHREQWAAETISRDPSADDHAVADAKRSIDRLNATRVALIGEVDSWVEQVIQPPRGAPLHTETIGSVIDRLAIAWVRWRRFSETAHLGLRDVDPPLALQQFTELSEAFDTLVLDIHEGRRRVPPWRTLKSYREPR